jgi:hypothetical protein
MHKYEAVERTIPCQNRPPGINQICTEASRGCFFNHSASHLCKYLQLIARHHASMISILVWRVTCRKGQNLSKLDDRYYLTWKSTRTGVDTFTGLTIGILTDFLASEKQHYKIKQDIIVNTRKKPETL